MPSPRPEKAFLSLLGCSRLQQPIQQSLRHAEKHKALLAGSGTRSADQRPESFWLQKR